MPLLALTNLDYAVVGVYILVLAYMGWHFARRQKNTAEYFLASRSVPWFALGLSIMATLMSSITYLSEPGEVWLSGLTTIVGKVFAVAVETVIVLLFIIPLLMRFRFTSAYEYLGYRFGLGTRVLGAALFCCLVISWMGFVVLAVSWMIFQVSGIRFEYVTIVVGLVGTIYTMFGGMRAVIWKEVLQVILMFGGTVLCMAVVMFKTESFLPNWITAADTYLAPKGGVIHWLPENIYTRNTVLGFAAMMFTWNLCTHLGNQMVIQRYFSSGDMKRARRSFIVGVCASLTVNTFLVFAGLAFVYYYIVAYPDRMPVDPSVQRKFDMIFPSFMVRELPPGLGGAVLAAVLSAAMSTIDSGINAVSTVLSVERRRLQGRGGEALGVDADRGSDMLFARLIVLLTGILVTFAAYGLNELVADRNMLEMMPRSFNCFLVPLGLMFFLGFFVPRVGSRAAVLGAVASYYTAISIAYFKEIYGHDSNLSLTLILPSAFVVGFVVAVLFSLIDRSTPKQVAGLTWFTRHELPDIPKHLIAEWVLAADKVTRGQGDMVTKKNEVEHVVEDRHAH
jgi:SSS family solute:Na+ symporter